MTSFDVIVIGGGHNGLVAAATLAKSGRKVLVLEAAGELGGAARTEEFAPGFRVSSAAHIVNRLSPDVVATLELAKHGLALFAETTAPDGGVAASPFAPTVALSRGGNHLVLHGAYGESLSGTTASEQVAWKHFRAQLFRYAGVLKPFLSRRPPEIGGLSLGDAAALGSAALSLRRLGKEDMRDFLRVLLMNVADAADEQLDDDRLKGLLAFDAVLGCHLGPRSPTSLLGLLYRLTGEAGGAPGAQFIPQGGMGAVVAAMIRAAEAAGVTLRTNAPVGKIVVANGAASGVVLSSGEEIAGKTIVSAINPATTFLDLVGTRFIDTGLVRKVRAIRMKGNVAKLHLALDRAPAFDGIGNDALKGRLVIAPSATAVDNAFNPAKYGEFSPQPVMEITLPSLTDGSLAPAGACVLSANVQFAPYALREGWEAGRPKFLEAVMAQLEAHAPGIGKSVQHTELLTPLDIKTRFRMPGGHWHHGELQADQMLMSRPVAGMSGYDTPVTGLYLCGAGSHPGGGVSGTPGLNAARVILGERR